MATDLRSGLKKIEAGKYKVLGRRNWTVTRAAKHEGEAEPWQIAGWWYLEGPGGVFHEAETAEEMKLHIRSIVQPKDEGGWV